MPIRMADRCLAPAASSAITFPGLEHSITIRIDWADLDLFGHVNNVMFFKYMQASRLNFCEQLGLTSLNEPGKLSFLVASSHCDFRKPLYYPGEVQVRTKVKSAGNTSFVLSHTLTDGRGELCGEGEDVLVLYDYHVEKKIPVSKALKSMMGL